MSDKEIQIVLANIVSYILKRHDAPISAETHLDHAIASLSEYCPDWKPLDEEAESVIKDAREHMAFYHKWAEKPWPVIKESGKDENTL